MRTLAFTVTGQHITGSPISDLIGNTKNYVEAAFTLSSEWDAYSLKVAVFTANSVSYDVILDSNNKAKVPDIALAGDKFTVGLIGGGNGTRYTTDTAEVRVEESVRTRPPYDAITMYDSLGEAISDLQDDVSDLDEGKQPKTLETPLTIDGSEETTVEGALGKLNDRAVVFDDALSDSSENAVQNKVLKAIIDTLQAQELDTPLTIGGVSITTVEAALGALLAVIPAVDASLDSTSTNAIMNKAVKAVIDAKQPSTLETAVTIGGVSKTTVQEALTAIATVLAAQTTIDTALDDTSEHAVQNKAIAAAVNAKQGKTLDTAITVNGTQYTTVESALGAINTLLANHLTAQVATSGGVHDFRKDPNSNDLQYYDETTQAWITISTGGGGGSVTVDSALSTSSVNPVQNKVLTNYMYDYLQTKALSSSMTIGGQTITSVEAALTALLTIIPTIDSALSSSSENGVQNKVIKSALDDKQPSTLSSSMTIDGNAITTVEAALTALNTLAAGNKTNLGSHATATILSAAGVHGLRYYSDKLQKYNSSTEDWDDITTGGGGGDEERLDKIDQNILALTLALALYQQAEVVGTADNIVVEIFDDTSGYIIVKGAYDSSNHRLYA